MDPRWILDGSWMDPGLIWIMAPMEWNRNWNLADTCQENESDRWGPVDGRVDADAGAEGGWMTPAVNPPPPFIGHRPTAGKATNHPPPFFLRFSFLAKSFFLSLSWRWLFQFFLPDSTNSIVRLSIPHKHSIEMIPPPSVPAGGAAIYEGCRAPGWKKQTNKKQRKNGLRDCGSAVR